MKTFERELLAEVNSNLDARVEEQGMRPGIEVWPVDDEFGRWVAYHEARDRAVICSTTEFRDMTFCRKGSH